MKKRTGIAFLVLMTVCMSFVWANGQQESKGEGELDFPTRPIKLIIPWSPGGSSDAMGRALSAVAKDHLGVELNVVNRDGAGGTIAATEVKGMAPDGYTIQLNAVGVFTTQPVLREVQYTIDDFDFVCGLSYEPIVILVHASSPYMTLKDLQKADDTLTIGANAVGSLPYIAAMDIMYQLGVDADAVPMKGGGPSLAALLGQQVDVAVVHPNEAIQHVNNGDLRFLGICSPERSDLFPDIPSVYESGVDADYAVWKWLQTPDGVDPAVMAFLTEKFQDMMNDPKFQEFANNSKLTLIDIDGAEVEKRLKSQAAATSKAIHNIGIK